jgi:hypothetical protein
MDRIARLAVSGTIALLAASSAAAKPPVAGWLDHNTPANWNKPAGAIPRGPKSPFADMIAQCEKRGAEETKQSPATAETRQVTAAGWLGATVERRAGDTVVVFARNGLDGMCRPLAYQYFVFVGGRFVGTLAPQPMDSREDGSGVLEKKPQARRFTVEYARFRESDGRCCPSRTSTVTFEVRDAPGGPLVVPARVVTKRTPPMR